MKIALYARVSTGYQVDKDSLPFQQKEMKAYCEHIMHRSDYVVYEDAGKSGKNVDRPGFQRMMSDIRSGKISHVIVYKIDRISRNLVDFSQMYDEFKKYRVTFISLNEQFDTSNALGEAVLKIILVFAELERKMTSERVKAVMIGRANSGKWNGARMPYGWRWNSEKELPEHDPVEAENARMIYKIYAEQKSTTQLMRYLNDNGIATKRGGRWTTKTLCSYLRNPLNKGDYRYNYRESANGAKKPTEEVVYVPGVFDPLIPPELWDRVNAIIDKHAEENGSAGRQHTGKQSNLFSGILVCGACNSNIVVQKHDRKRANGFQPTLYRCRSYVETNCKHGHSSDVWLAPLVFNMLYRFMLLDDFSFSRMEELEEFLLGAPEFNDYKISDISLGFLYKLVKRKENVFLLETASEKKTVRSNYTAEISKYERALERLDNAFLFDDSTFSQQEYSKRRSELTEKLTALKNKAAEKVIEYIPAKIPQGILTAFDEAAAGDGNIDIIYLTTQIGIKDLHDFLYSIIEKIVVLDKKIIEILFRNGIDLRFI